MLKRLALLALVASAPAALAQTPPPTGGAPPFPEYPDFQPGAIAAADQKLFSLALLDLFEAAPTSDGVPVRIDGLYRIGNDYTRFYLKTEGDVEDGAGDAEAQALYSRLVGPFTEVQAGLRLETAFGDGALRARPGVAVGLEALVPYFFEAEPVLFVSYRGDVSARFTGSYDLLVTQRLVAQPRVEANAALQRVEDWGVGSGLNDVELGLRLRYEIRREVAPYVGVSWTNQFGGTADYTRADGGDASQVRLVFGVRLFR